MSEPEPVPGPDELNGGKYAPPPIVVNGDQTPDKLLNANQTAGKELNMVNQLSGGKKSRRRNSKKTVRRRNKNNTRKVVLRKRTSKQYKKDKRHTRAKHYNFIGGNDGNGGGITVPQVGASCTTGPNCPGAMNAGFIATANQAAENSSNDGFVGDGFVGGKRRKTKKGAKN
jgi:hypothetical protein